jgi:hypothetical protein
VVTTKLRLSERTFRCEECGSCSIAISTLPGTSPRAVGVADQRVAGACQVQQQVPVGVVARQPGTSSDSTVPT